jgi:hypothetical protein
MATEQQSVADIFRRAQAIRKENPQGSLKDLKAQLVKEFGSTPFPSALTLTIPEQDARAPEEDWTAGLPLIMRGIQQQDWKEIANGIILSLEQTDNYEKERGRPGAMDEWHDRVVGIEESTQKGVNKWMPQELVDLAERKARK